MVKAAEAVAVTVTDPPRLTKLPLIVMLLLVNCEFAIPPRVPPKVKLPVLVTVPVRVMPFTVPVPLTDVTVP